MIGQLIKKSIYFLNFWTFKHNKMFFSKQYKIETSCGITAYEKIINKINEYNCNELCQITCEFDEILNNLLNSQIDGFFIINFDGSLLLDFRLINILINNHIMIIEKNGNEYTIHQSFLLVYKQTSLKINKQQMNEVIKKLKYINDRSYTTDRYGYSDLVKTIELLFWIKCVDVIKNEGIKIIFITPCHSSYLRQNGILKYQIIFKQNVLNKCNFNLKNMSDCY